MCDFLSIGLLGANFRVVQIRILWFSLKMHMNLSSAKMVAILSKGRWVNTLTLSDVYVPVNKSFIMACHLLGAKPLFKPVLHVFLAATKQLYEWYFLSVCLSVCHTFLTMFPSSYHHKIFRSYYQWQKWYPWKGQGQRSKVKVTEVTTQLNRFRTVTPVWIHICWWNHAYGLMILRRGALLFFKVIGQISRSHGSKKRGNWPRLRISGL